MGSNITNLSIFKFIDDIRPAHLHIFKNSMCITARTWKQPRCPSADEWKKSCGTYTQWNIAQPLKRINSNEVDETGAYLYRVK